MALILPNAKDVQTFQRDRLRLAALEAKSKRRFRAQPPRDEPRRVRFFNDSGYIIPAYGVFARSGIVMDRARPVCKAYRPSATFRRRYAVNSNRDVPVNRYGVCYVSGMVEALYDTGTPADGEDYGPQPETFTLKRGYPGATVDGIVDATRKIVYAQLNMPIVSLLGKTTSAITAGSTTAWEIHSGAPGSSAATTFTAPSAYTWVDLDDDMMVRATWLNLSWLIEPLFCNVP